MVGVDVNREQVNVEQAKVAVERQQLENRQEFARAGIELEVQKLSITADRDVQIEFAKSLASFLANGHMTLYGTLDTASTMLTNMAKGFGLRAMIDSFVEGAPASQGALTNGHQNGATPKPVSSDAVGALIGQIGKLIQPAVGKLTGDATGADSTDKVAKALAENPAFLAALTVALDSQTHTVAAPTPVHSEGKRDTNTNYALSPSASGAASEIIQPAKPKGAEGDKSNP